MLQEMRNFIQMAIDSKKINDQTLKDGIVHLCSKEISKKYLLVINSPQNIDLVNSFLTNYPNADVINECQVEKSKFILHDLLIEEIKKDHPNIESLVEYIKSQVIIIKNDNKMKDFKELMRMGAKLAGGSAPSMSKIRLNKTRTKSKRKSNEDQEDWIHIVDYEKNLKDYFVAKTNNLPISIEHMYFGSKNIAVETYATLNIEERPFLDAIKNRNIQYFHNLLKESRNKLSQLIDMNLIFSGVKMRYDIHYSRKVDGLVKFTARSLQLEELVKYNSGYSSMGYDPIKTEIRDFLFPAKIGIFEIGNTDSNPDHSTINFRMKFYLDYDKFINILIEEHESFE